jgi:hypothetical protein
VLQLALPGIPKRELYWAYNFLAGSMMLALSGTERVDRLSEGLCHAKDLQAARQRLLNYCAGGLLAMVTAERLSGRAQLVRDHATHHVPLTRRSRSRRILLTMLDLES